MKDFLESLYPNRIIEPENVTALPEKEYMVYILTYNNIPIVLGHGKRIRAKIIFDDISHRTCHMKALLVRLYLLFGNSTFHKYIVSCNGKQEAKQVETNLHHEIGGNNPNIPGGIRNQLFADIATDSIIYLLLEIALRSSFDGLSDLRKWRSDGLISDTIWAQISERLQLNQLGFL
jgi:hypothetical protein